MDYDKRPSLEDRFVNFASDIARTSERLPKSFTGQYYVQQILRSSGGAALNSGEMQGASTEKDLFHKLSITLKELKETRVNLKISRNLNIMSNDVVEIHLDELEQLIKITASIILKKKRHKVSSE